MSTWFIKARLIVIGDAVKDAKTYFAKSVTMRSDCTAATRDELSHVNERRPH
ncbi:MAG: hypothetical protein ABI623_08615 [bacterium]